MAAVAVERSVERRRRRGMCIVSFGWWVDRWVIVRGGCLNVLICEDSDR